MLFKFGGVFRKVWRSALVLGTLVIGTNTLFVAPVSAATGINQQLNFQGRLLNAQGAVAPDGYYNVEFKIYQDGTGTAAGNPGGTLKWTEDWLNNDGHGVRVLNGYISVQLGSVNPFGSSIDWNQDTLWLSLNIGNTNTTCAPFTSCVGDGEMLPMKRLSAVPYALNSAKLGGLTAAGFIQNTTTVQTATNMAIDGTARADTGILTPYIDTNTATALNIGTTNATSINLNQNVTVAANKTLTLTGGTTANRPASPTEGMMWYDTTTKQLLMYSNGKWQADRNTATKVVAASNASQALKDAADYVATGTGDQTVINNALTAAAGGKVYLTEGTYRISASISIPDKTTLAGAGSGTIITIPNSQNGTYAMITNSNTSTGTGMTIRDFTINGNAANQTSGATDAIYLNGVGDAYSSPVLPGALIDNMTITSLFGGHGVKLSVSDNSSIVNSTISQVSDGVYSANSGHNTITNNKLFTSVVGIYLDANSYNDTISGNIINDNTYGILTYSARNNIISSNIFTNNGGGSFNNSIYLDGPSTNNKITDNTLMDTTAGTTNYAINIVSSSAANNYLSDNTFTSDPGTATINDLGTNTTYANQSRAEAGGQLTQRTANNTQAFAVQNAAGANIFAVDTTNSQVVIGNATTAGKVNLSDGSSNTLTLSVGALAGDYTVSIPTITANDTVCLQGLANCGSSLTVGALDGGTANANGMTISGSNVYLQSASASYAGLVNTGTQTFAGAKTFNDSLTLAAAKTINLTGSTTANRPASPTEGMMYYDTTTKQLLIYGNGKWQADRATATKIVAASNSSQAAKDGADYVADGEAVVGTGTVDGDQVQINAAIAALPASGGSIYLTEGTYRLDGSIVLPSNVKLSGAGDATVVSVNNSFGSGLIFVTNSDTTNGNTNITIRDIKFDGNRANNGTSTMVGINFTKIGSGTGATATGGATITNTTFNAFQGDMILFSTSNNNRVADNTFIFGNNEGVEFATGVNNQVVGNSFNNVNRAIEFADVDNSVIADNSIDASADINGAVDLNSGSSNNIVNGNSFKNNANISLRIATSSSNTITGNVFTDNGSTGAISALSIQGNSNYNVITNNTFRDTAGTGYAIDIAAAADDTSLSDNSLNGTGANAINDLGVGTIYANQIDANGKLINKSVAGTSVQATTNGTAVFTVQNASGANIFAVDTTNSQIVLGNATTAGKINLSDGSSNTLTLSVGALAGNYTVSIPTVTANDTVCLQGLANCGSSLSVGALDGGTANANGMTISGSNVYLQSASASYAGLVNTGTQTFAGAKTFNDSLTLAAAKTINLTGSTTANRPASPTEGMMYYDTTTKQLLVYSNGKWQGDRSTSTKIVAASNASQALKDAADYVATGTSDQGVINSALTAATGGKVYLTEGTYSINGTISIPANTTLAGAGYGTLVQMATLATNTALNLTTSGAYATIQDIRLDGNASTQSGTGNQNAYYAWATNHVTFRNNWITNFKNTGILTNGAGSYTTITGNTTSGNPQAIHTTGSYDTISDNNSSADGIAIDVADGASYSTVTGNTVRGATVNNGGIYIYNANNITVTSNTVEGQASSTWGAGILVDSSNRVTITGNTVSNSTVAGIRLMNADNSTVSGNTTYNTGGSSYNGGIIIEGDSDNNTITGNNLTDVTATTTNYAIDIQTATANSNYLANNTFNMGTINDAGTGTLYGGQYNSSTSYLIQPATNITIGGASTTTTLQGNTAVTLNATTATGMVCRNTGTGILSACDASFLAPTATNFIRNSTSVQSSSNFYISGTGKTDTAFVTPALRAATDGTSGLSFQNAAGTTTIMSVDTTNSRVLVAGALDTTTATALSIGTTTATSISIGKSAIATNLSSSTINVGTSGSATTISGAAQTTNGQAGNAMTIKGSNGLGSGNGGMVTIQGGNAGATSGANGGNLVLAGGTGSGTGVGGLVVINSAAYSTSTTQTSATSVDITQANIDLFGAIILSATASNVNFTLTSPTLGTNATGRVIYVTAANGSQDFTLRANVGGGTGVEQNIAMRQNTTATMIWNGSQWTAAGASSSTTLQAAYDNTLQSAGGAELVVSKTSATNGLTIRDSSVNSVNGALLTVQSSSAANLFSVNSNVTEYSKNSGAETYGASTTTFPASTWAAINGSTVTRHTTAGDYIATGQGSVSVVAPATAYSGVTNTLSTSLTANMTYNVSFSARVASASNTLTDIGVYYSIDGSTRSVTCATSQTAKTSVWTKINCAFQAPSSGITASNAILIEQVGATAHTFYVDNLSVTIAADYNLATDGNVDDNTNFATNWPYTTGIGTGSTTRNPSDGYNASSSAGVTITSGLANAGIRNKLSMYPLTGTLYRVSVYAKLSTGTFTDFKVRYSPDGGTNYVECVDYNTQTLTTTSWTQVTCYIKTVSTTVSNPYIYFVEGSAVARTYYVDAFSMTLASNSTPNVQVGSGSNGGPTTLFTLDKGASAPIAANNDALLGSMYYDTTLGKLQCYESDGWGACGSSPDNIITISPEYTNAVMHGTGVGTMTSDLCSGALGINDGTLGQPTICQSDETYNFYRWTSPQASEQAYSIYVTYQLPATFKEFASGQTSLQARVSSTSNAYVKLQIYKNHNGLSACGNNVTLTTLANTWQAPIASGTADPSTCGFVGGDSIVFKITMGAWSNANAYIGNLNFTFTNK